MLALMLSAPRNDVFMLSALKTLAYEDVMVCGVSMVVGLAPCGLWVSIAWRGLRPCRCAHAGHSSLRSLCTFPAH